jgi:titin
VLDSQHPEGWEKMKSLEARSAHRRLDVEELPIGPPHFVTELVVSHLFRIVLRWNTIFVSMFHSVLFLQGNTTLNEGGVAHFEAQIEPIHDPDLRVEFLKDGQPLKLGSRIHTLCDFGYVALDVSALIEADAGEYECRVYNKLGEARSKVRLGISGRGTLDTSSQRPEGLDKIAALEARRGRAPEEEARTFQKPVFTHALESVEAEEGAGAHLAARLIPVGDPTLVVEWFKDGQVISSGSRINYINDFGCVTLDISSLRSSDEGVYECRAANALGSAATSASVRVAARGSLLLDSQHPEGMRKITALEMNKAKRQLSEVAQAFEKPAFLTPLTGTSEVMEGRNAHMECRVVPVGDPSMRFEWYKNGEQLKTGSR